MLEDNTNLQVETEANSEATLSNTTLINHTTAAINTIEDQIAADNELHPVTEFTEIQTIDYDQASMEELVAHLKYLVTDHKITQIKNNVEETKKAFNLKFVDYIEHKKEQFLNENPEATESDFDHSFPLKNTFDAYFQAYREKCNTHFQNHQESLKNNLNTRLAIIEKIRLLVDNSENIGDALRQLGELRDQWKEAGSIPKDKYNHVWNNYHFQIERFYDQLHLDRESRDLDFKYNLEQKQKIIARAQELLDENDIIKSYRELQNLHRIWKEEIGPVDREIREEIWNQFSEISKQLFDKREALFEQIRASELNNLSLKVDLISKIDFLSKEPHKSHSDWQRRISEIENLKTQFYAIGRVPNESLDEVWKLFKLANKNFNTHRNNFYKNLKQEQHENLVKKTALCAKAEELMDSVDFKNTTPLMKSIQEDWKKIGRTPKNTDAVLWQKFRAACNHYFDRLHQERNKENEEELAAYTKKKDYLELLKDFHLSGDHTTDLKEIKNHINNWKMLGRVGHNKRYIDSKFNKILDVLFNKLNISRKDAETVRFNNRLENLADQNDTRKIQSEILFIQRKIEETNSNILQLQNNVQFISNATEDNPFIKEVRKNIMRYEEDLQIWKEKLEQIKNIELS